MLRMLEAEAEGGSGRPEVGRDGDADHESLQEGRAELHASGA